MQQPKLYISVDAKAKLLLIIQILLHLLLEVFNQMNLPESTYFNYIYVFLKPLKDFLKGFASPVSLDTFLNFLEVSKEKKTKK